MYYYQGEGEGWEWERSEVGGADQENRIEKKWHQREELHFQIRNSL
jgi:hypothetical protein